MARLNGTTVDDAHAYLAKARPDFDRAMGAIRNEGGPWPCPTCGGASLLCYRCSKCGAELHGESSTTATR